MTKRSSSELAETIESEIESNQSKRPSIEQATSSDTIARSQSTTSKVETLRRRVLDSLSSLVDIDPSFDLLGTFTSTLKNLGNLSEARRANEMIIADSDWGRIKLERIQQALYEMNGKVDELLRRRSKPHVHEHTSSDCTLCQGCLIHIEEAIVRRHVPYFDDLLRNNNGRNLYPRGGFMSRRAAGRVRRGGFRKSLSDVDENFAPNFDNY